MKTSHQTVIRSSSRHHWRVIGLSSRHHWRVMIRCSLVIESSSVRHCSVIQNMQSTNEIELNAAVEDIQKTALKTPYDGFKETPRYAGMTEEERPMQKK